MLDLFFENPGNRKEKFALILTLLLFGLVLLAIYGVVEMVKGFNAVHSDLGTAPIVNKEDVIEQVVGDEEHL
jgi:hypothetical protein